MLILRRKQFGADVRTGHLEEGPRPEAATPGLPNVYQEMLLEAGAGTGPSTPAPSEPPLKKLKRPGEKTARVDPPKAPEPDEDEDDEDIEFEDVALPPPIFQTMERDSDEEESEDDIEFEDVDLGAVHPDVEVTEEPKRLTLNLSAHTPTTPATKKGAHRRKPISKEERERRITVHRTHLLCLMLHCALRNRWCDDGEVQKSMRSLLTKKIVNYLNPSSDLPQFGQTQSLKTGLEQAGSIFKAKFHITEKGLRRALWAEDPEHISKIEDNELMAVEGREPMPRNVADFKDHPVFALERHLRRNEVLIPEAQPAGTVSAGSKAPLEKVYRRRDVRIARSRDKWYRSYGREVKPMEVPVKFLPRRSNARPGEFVDDGYGGDERDAAGMPVFTEEQTELYHAPPVVNGRVPKNKFGNIDLYVASMVPQGGVHVTDEFDAAARAAYILGIDYAPALTGFNFKGKHGTAVLNGVVVAREHEEAVRAVMEGLGDMEAQVERSKRSLAAIRMWKRFLTALRIRERVWAGVDPEERAEEEREMVGEIAEMSEHEESMATGGSMVEGDNQVEEDASQGRPGGFMVDNESKHGGGGFVAEEVEVEEEEGGGGGFVAGDEDVDSDRGVGFAAQDVDVGESGGFAANEEGENNERDGDMGLEDLSVLGAEKDEDEDEEVEDAPSDVTEEYDMEEEDGGGGFLVE
ncbi:DNA repair protein rhp41 [Colletotrichum sp. SAR 10_70]|nr:DNA repair protein rhp41 [Colletotrichum sp. SAR 10_70]KAI8151633.1 DNA repair protein rhp41 [Colletotrichum sp. SAR 10_71]KAI8172245.1 DNA repair protein rhp41 [Colletotrichum sp. SAR 10_75]